MECKICGSKSNELFSALILNKYEIKYFQCEKCRFIQTEEVYWLKEAYNEAIGQLDVGLVTRNQQLSDATAKIISKNFDPKGKFLDYGGGYGLFVRLMRDKGFDFYRQDSFCENIFAKYFDIDDLDEKGNFELLTAFEVFEHLNNPIEEITTMFKYAPSILFSTELQSGTPFKSVDDWWYFSPEAGQHIGLYTYESLQQIAKRFNKNLYSNQVNLHLLTDKKLPQHTLKRSIADKVMGKISDVRSKSLLQKDYEKIKASLNTNESE